MEYNRVVRFKDGGKTVLLSVKFHANHLMCPPPPPKQTVPYSQCRRFHYISCTTLTYLYCSNMVFVMDMLNLDNLFLEFCQYTVYSTIFFFIISLEFRQNTLHSVFYHIFLYFSLKSDKTHYTVYSIIFFFIFP